MSRPDELPSLNAIKAFEAIARLQSVSHAAEELHVTHGAVSRQLRLLEEALGCALFHRQGRGLVLTDDGRYLRDEAGEALTRLRSACQRLRRRSTTTLVLGCPGSVLARWMIPRLDRLARDLPQLTLHLSASEQTPAAAMEGLDAALLVAAPPWPSSWQVHVLAAESIGPVLSPRYPGAARLQGAAADALLDEPLLHTHSRPQAWPDWARTQGLPTDALIPGQSFEHLYYLLEAAVAGLGVAIAPRQLVADDLAAGRLLAPWDFSDTGASWALCAPERRADPRLTALANWLSSGLRND